MFPAKYKRWLLSYVALGAGCLPLTGIARADKLEDEIKVLAAEIEEELKSKGGTQLILRDFRGPSATSAGVKIKQVLKDTLTGKGLTIARVSAPFIIDGTYRAGLDSSNMVAIIDANIYDGQFNMLGSFSKRVVTDEEDVIELFGLTLDRTNPGAEAIIPPVAGATPAAGTPAVAAATGTPVAGTPAAGTPAAGTPAAGTPAAGTPAAGTPAAANPAAGSATAVGTPGNPGTPGTPGNAAVGTATAGTAATGNPAAGSPANATPPGTAVAALGAGNNAPPANSLQNQIQTAVQKPQVFVDPAGKRAFASQGSMFSLEVIRLLPDSTEEIVPILNEGGLAVVDLRRDDRFIIRVHNDSPYDCAAQLTLDGVNMFAFSDVADFRRNGIYYVLRQSNTTLRGWHKSNTQVFEFVVGPSQLGAAAELGVNTAEVGTINVIIKEAWLKEEFAEVAKHREIRDQAFRSRGNAIRRGDLVTTTPKATATRVLGDLLASIAIRYPQPEDNNGLPQ